MKLTYLLIITLLAPGLFFVPAEAGWTIYDIDNGLATNYIVTMHTDLSGNVWIGTDNQGVQRFDGIDWNQYTEYDGLINNSINEITIDPMNNIWFATTFGVGFFDGVSVWDEFNAEDSLLYVDIKTMVVDDSGYLWLGTFGAGVIVHDADTTTVKHYTIDSGLASNNMLSSMIDRNGNIWFGTRDGVSMIDPDGNWTSYDHAGSGLLDDTVNIMMQSPDGDYWFGTNLGLSRFDGVSVWTNYTETGDGLAPGAVTALAADSNGYIWIGHEWTSLADVWVSRFDGSGWETFDLYYGPNNNITVSGIAVDTSGVVWFATRGDGVRSFEHEPLDVTDETDPVIPAGFSLGQNYPNPFNSSTVINYSLSNAADVRISIYNALGQKIMELVDAAQAAGEYMVHWNGVDYDGVLVSSGIYFYEIRAGEYSSVRKMVMMK